MRTFVLTVALLATAASAQQQGSGGRMSVPIKPIVIDKPTRTVLRVIVPSAAPTANNMLPIVLGKSEWAQVDTIDGKRRPVRLHPGQTVVIRGSGFGAWIPQNSITLFPGSTDIGAPFTVLQWDNTAITAEVPRHHALLDHSLSGRLYISGAAVLRGTQIRTKTEVLDIHFVADP